jgi:hypothetical protein
MTKPRQDLASLRIITGDDVVDAVLKQIQVRGSDQAIRAAIRAAFQPLKKAIRRAINASPASPRLKAAARLTVASRFAKAKGGAMKGQYQAKVGMGVGRQMRKGYKTRFAAQKAKRAGMKRKRTRGGKTSTRGVGVGISSTDIHWPILGTDERFHGRKTSKSRIRELGAKVARMFGRGGKSVGKMPPDLHGLMAPAISAANTECFAAARSAVCAILAEYVKH